MPAEVPHCCTSNHNAPHEPAEGKRPVSRQGEHPEMISIIYCADILRSGTRQANGHLESVFKKGKYADLPYRGRGKKHSNLVGWSKFYWEALFLASANVKVPPGKMSPLRYSIRYVR